MGLLLLIILIMLLCGGIHCDWGSGPNGIVGILLVVLLVLLLMGHVPVWY
jgi:hypothetical protein